MINEEIILTCKPLHFYSKNDELLMLQWLKKIKCIKKINKYEDAFNLHISSDYMSYQDFKNLLGLFVRYKFDRNQLKSFIDIENEDLIEKTDNPQGSHHNIYPYREQEAAGKEEIILKCTPLDFYTKADEDLMFRLIKKIKCIQKYYGIRDVLYLCMPSHTISKKCLADLQALFARYHFEEKQLKVFERT
jgi:hypothetical protein